MINLSKNKNLLLGLVYRSPNSTEENKIALNYMISSLNEENFTRTVVMGYFNYRDIDWNHWISEAPEDHSSHRFIEAVRDSFLYHHVKFNTRFGYNHRSSLLDLVFSSDELLLNNIEQLSLLGKSDHVSIIFDIQCYDQNHKHCSVKYAYDRGNYEAPLLTLIMRQWMMNFQSLVGKKNLEERD